MAPRARRAIRWRMFQRGFERGFERLRHAYRGLLDAAGAPPVRVHPGVPRRAASRSSCSCRGSARTSSRTPTAASSSCTCAPRPARASRRPRGSPTRSRTAIRADHPGARDSDTILDNIGLPYSGINLTHIELGADRPGRRRHHGLAQAGSPPDRRLRRARCAASWPREFPGVTFYFLPADIVTPDPEFRPARADRHPDRRRATSTRNRSRRRSACSTRCARCPAWSTRASSRRFDYPDFDIDVDRTKAPQSGLHRARRREQPAQHAERQLPDHADVLPEPAERRELQRRRADAAVRHPVAAATCRTSRSPARRRRPRRSWPTSRRSRGRRRWRRSPTTTSAASSTSTPSVQGRDLGAVGRDIDAHRRRQPRATCRAAASSPCAASSRPCAASYHRPAGRPRLLDRARLSADRRELPVLARPVHHHHGAAGGAGGHRAVPVLHRTRR